MVIEHELMHQETLLYMVQELSPELKIPPKTLPHYLFTKGPPSVEVVVPVGRATLGAPLDSLSFGWDNEFPRQVVEVPAFKIDSAPVTNGQFLGFVEDHAYEDPKYWKQEDWAWKVRWQVHHPHFWIKREDEWFYHTLFDLLPLSKVCDWPIFVSLAEARAYARWKGKRLPTEGEFHRAAYGSPDGRENPYPWGEDQPRGWHGNFNFTHWSPTPVRSHPQGISAWGVHELVGNGWEWTETSFGPFPGFVPHKSYPAYSADFFDGKHFVLKGASWATAVDLLRPSFRNWFHARYPYVRAKFRCVSHL